MNGQPWGRTGRVTLTPHRGEVWFCVDLADCHLGVVSIASQILADTAASTACDLRRTGRTPHWSAGAEPFPTRDHAVMWVLRHAAPDVWRAERPVVWRVTWQERYRGWCAEGAKSLGVFPGYSRHYHRSNDGSYIHPWRRALTDACFYARAEYAARAAR